MFVWKNRKTIVDFDESMISCRNALVREINFAFSPDFQKIKEDETIANIHQTNKNLRQIAEDRLNDPTKKKAVKVKLIEEALNPEPDFNAANLLMKYLDVTVEDIGKGIYHDFKNKDNVYARYIKDNKFKEALAFLKYFSEEYALSELKYLIDKASESKSYDGFSMLIKKLFVPPFNKLEKDEELKKLLEWEFENAEIDKRLEDVELINKFIKDDEKWNRVKALKALLNKDYDDAIKHLKKIETKENLKNLIIDSYWEEIEKTKNIKDNITHLRNAFDLAYYGGLKDEEHNKYLEHPAKILFEHYINKPMATENDYQETVIFAEVADPEQIKDILAKKFISLIEENKSSFAVKLKKIYKVDFKSSDFEEKENVLEKFDYLTETKGVFKLPKGEKNLHAALDMALIFDLGKNSVDMINSLLCRLYLSENRYEEAKMYFVPDDRLTLELIENIISEFIDEKKYYKIYDMFEHIKFNFPDDIIRNKKSEIAEMLVNKDYAIENLEKMIVIEDVFKLHFLPGFIYSRILNYCNENVLEGSEILIELSIPLIKKADSLIKIKIYRTINNIKIKEPLLAPKVEEAYKSILPPTLLDWLIYLLKILFKME